MVLYLQGLLPAGTPVIKSPLKSSIMKKITGALFVSAIFLFASCTDEKKETTTKTISTPKTQAAPREKNTVINVDEKGIKVSTKKVDVNYSPKKNN